MREADLFNGKGLESIGVRVTEIPNYTVKNGCFDMCWPILINNSATEQCEVRAMYLHWFGRKPEVEICRKWICMIWLIDKSGTMLGSCRKWCRRLKCRPLQKHSYLMYKEWKQYLCIQSRLLYIFCCLLCKNAECYRFQLSNFSYIFWWLISSVKKMAMPLTSLCQGK